MTIFSRNEVLSYLALVEGHHDRVNHRCECYSEGLTFCMWATYGIDFLRKEVGGAHDRGVGTKYIGLPCDKNEAVRRHFILRFEYCLPSIGRVQTLPPYMYYAPTCVKNAIHRIWPVYMDTRFDYRVTKNLDKARKLMKYFYNRDDEETHVCKPRLGPFINWYHEDNRLASYSWQDGIGVLEEEDEFDGDVHIIPDN